MEFEYQQALQIRRNDPPFYAIIMAAMLKADTINLKLLKALYPAVYEELERLYG